ncbi:hypothetical protein UFOVP117_249 [uncultured Caudovirales phage]|mgnify:CR=1 FL=1|jgi:hypothetical protein|uniref:Uncharacterized protein n=1 Tax=uncultured Caudovirales phage TaxID=2100421 RepID=A0A6J5L5U3_9CAUD|nr:hypothetical protein UFOVP117_249 [uncultured Caudovirales phage]
MKYVITESQLDKVIFRYLDVQDLNIIKIGASTYFSYPDDNFAQIKYGGNHANNELCFIFIGLIGKVSSLFSLDRYQSTRIIGQWVKKKLNLDGQMSNKMMHAEWSLKIPSE